MSEQRESERFDLVRPPVTRVRLGLYFEPIPDLSLSRVAGFVAQVATDFPTIQERLPLLSPWNTDNLASVLVSESGQPPFPLVTMTTSSGNTEIGFQGDRFTLAWSFDGAEPGYPGYPILREQLAEMFGLFCGAVEAGIGMPVSPIKAQCFYLNTLTEMPGAALAVYMLTGQEDVTPRALLDRRRYVGSRVTFTPPSPDVEVEAGVDSESDDASTLWIRATAEAEGDALVSLDTAHDALIDQFIALTPDWMRQGWNDDSHE